MTPEKDKEHRDLADEKLAQYPHRVRIRCEKIPRAIRPGNLEGIEGLGLSGSFFYVPLMGHERWYQFENEQDRDSFVDWVRTMAQNALELVES